MVDYEQLMTRFLLLYAFCSTKFEKSRIPRGLLEALKFDAAPKSTDKKHAGGMIYGHASDAWYDTSNLVRMSASKSQPILTVAINYRLSGQIKPYYYGEQFELS